MLFHLSTSVMQVRLNHAAISCHWHLLGQTYSSKNHLMMIYSTSQTVFCPSRISTALILTQTQWEV